MAESPIAIITGGGTGIGRAAALQLAALGWRVALVGRRSAKLDEALAIIREAHAKRATHANVEALAITVDVAQPGAAALIIEHTTQKWGKRIDALINNAAILIPGPIHQATDDALRQAFETNVFAPMRLLREVWPIMAEHGGGRIVNVSSLASVDPFPGLGVYGMTKSALDGLTRAINKEGQRDRIIAFSLHLGAVETEMLRSVVSENQIPRGEALAPAAAAKVIVACVRGQRDGDATQPIVLR